MAVSGGGNFKTKSAGRDPLRFVYFNKYCELDNRRVKLPAGLRWLKFRQSRRVDGVIKNCTVSQHDGLWYISFQVELIVINPTHLSTGLDAGVAELITLSDGTAFHPVNNFKVNKDKLVRLQHTPASEVKFSANWKKQKAKISRQHSHMANIRRDYLHKATTTISKNHAMIINEDLKV